MILSKISMCILKLILKQFFWLQTQCLLKSKPVPKHKLLKSLSGADHQAKKNRSKIISLLFKSLNNKEESQSKIPTLKSQINPLSEILHSTLYLLQHANNSQSFKTQLYPSLSQYSKGIMAQYLPMDKLVLVKPTQWRVDKDSNKVLFQEQSNTFSRPLRELPIQKNI